MDSKSLQIDLEYVESLRTSLFCGSGPLRLVERKVHADFKAWLRNGRIPLCLKLLLDGLSTKPN